MRNVLTSLRPCLVAASAFFALAPAASAAEHIVNGSFEDSSFSGGGVGHVALSGSDLPGWLITSSNSQFPEGAQTGFGLGFADTGNQFLILGDPGTASDFAIQQTITDLTPGASYDFIVGVLSRDFHPAFVRVAFLSGSSTSPFGGGASANDGYVPIRQTFHATSSTVVLEISGLEAEFPGTAPLIIDSVSVTDHAGIPEPTTWALMLSGVGLAGAGLRRRRGAFAQ